MEMGKRKGFFKIACLSILWLLVLAISSVNAKVPDIVLKQKKAVVTIYIYENDEMIAYGSGFIIDPDGIIATNYHVVSFLFKNPDTAIAIKMENGEFIKAQKMLSLDETNDVALIKVECKELPSLKLSQDYKPKQGEDVFVIGSPFGFDTTISNGIISSIRGTDEFLQITAPISPGSSGSPVFNPNGEVIGIATLIMEGGQNLNFAIPVKYITNIKKPEITKAETLKATIPSPVAELKAESEEKSFEEHVKLAKEHSKNGRHNEAIEEYTKAISIRPEDANLYLARGNTYKNLIKFLLEPESPDYYIIQEENNALYDKAIKDYSKAITFQPDNVTLYFARAAAYSEKGEWENAIKDLDKAIALKPDIAFLYNDRGKAYYDMKQYKLAIDNFTKAINLKPNEQKYRSIYFSPYENEYPKDYDKATNDMFLSEFYLRRGYSYQDNLQLNEAIRDYEKSTTVYPDSVATFFLDELYRKEGKIKEGIDFYSRVITLRPKEAYVYSVRADFYKLLKQYDKALRDYTKAIELNPKLTYYYLQRIDVYKELNQYSKAIGDYSKIIALDPDSPWLYYDRGELYVETKQKLKALNDFQKACDLDTSYCWRLTEYRKELERGEKWVLFSSSKNKSFYYDKTSIRQQPNKHIRVWARMEVDDVDAFIEEIKSKGQQIKGFENFSHSLHMNELDCSAEQIGIVSEIIYDEKGNTLFSHTFESIEMNPVIPDSIGEALYKVVCQKKQKS